MRMKFLPAALAALALSPVAAHAGAYDAAGFTWTGMYVGVHGGFGTGSSDWELSTGGSTSRDIDGGLLDIQAGYNTQLAKGVVVGVQLSASGTNIRGINGCSAGRCKSEVASLSDLTGRVGLNWGSSLVFLRGGVAYQNLNQELDTGSADFTEKSGSIGYVGGVGAEFYIYDNITSVVEYNYYDFGSNKSELGVVNVDDSNSISVVKAGFNIKFN